MNPSLPEGIQETVFTEVISEQLAAAKERGVEYRFDPKADFKNQLAQLLYVLIHDEILSLEESSSDKKQSAKACLDLCNALIQTINTHRKTQHSLVVDSGLLLEYGGSKSLRPNTPLSRNALFTGAGRGFQLGSQYAKELKSADSIDILCSFITWGGLVSIKNELLDFANSGKKIRVITTAYMGATDSKAVELLADLPGWQVPNRQKKAGFTPRGAMGVSGR